MAQNIYDREDFFANYSALERSVHGLASAPEWPRLRSLLPDITGRRVLDLGCGFGWFCRWAKSPEGGNAESVHGVDLSSNMLERAQRLTAESGLEGITYEQADLEGFAVPEKDHGTYDVVFSSLALHYLVHLPELMEQVHHALRSGGMFVFSVEHPIFTAPSRPGIVTQEVEGEDDGAKKEWRYWPMNEYQREGLRVTNWLADGVRKQHRTLTTYLELLLRMGFELTALNEWFPERTEFGSGWEKDEMVRPTFLLMRWMKKNE